MRCPYCKNKYEGLIFIFNTRCAKCGKKASNYNKKRYSLVSCVNIILALLIYALLNNYFGIFKNYISDILEHHSLDTFLKKVREVLLFVFVPYYVRKKK